MANILTNLIPDIYVALDEVSRELVGVIPGVTLDAQVARAAVNQTVRSPVAPAVAATDITPGVTPPNDGDQTIGNVAITMTKARRVPIRWNGEETKGVDHGVGQNRIFVDQVKQALRTLVNEMESDVAAEARKGASRAYGTAGTTPFGTAGVLTDSSEVLKIIEANGGGRLERSLVLNPDAMSNVRGKQSVLFKVNESGSSDLLRRGIMGDLHGAQVRQTAQLGTVTPGTGALYQLNGAHAVGATTINVDTGTGTILAGDVITIGNGTPADSNKYVVTGALAGGALTIGAPGLRSSHVDNDAVTVTAAFTPSVLFAKSAIVLATRAPALPKDPSGRERDSAVDRMTISDPVTGLNFEMSVYEQYRQLQYEIAAVWGQKAIKQEHIALLLG